jgi:hypothetical protein
MIKLIAGIVSSYRYYHHRQDCRTRWQWPVSSVSQPHHGEYDIAVQKLLKNTSRASQHVTPRAALWAKRFSLRNTRHHQSPPTATPPAHHPHTTTTSTWQCHIHGAERKKNSQRTVFLQPLTTVFWKQKH